MAVSSQWLGKHVLAATDTNAEYKNCVLYEVRVEILEARARKAVSRGPERG
jgi:hypothetical protein